MKHELTFQIEKETKGTVRYQEVGEGGSALERDEKVVGTLYVRKAALTTPYPDQLNVTVEFEDTDI